MLWLAVCKFYASYCTRVNPYLYFIMAQISLLHDCSASKCLYWQRLQIHSLMSSKPTTVKLLQQCLWQLLVYVNMKYVCKFHVFGFLFWQITNTINNYSVTFFFSFISAVACFYFSSVRHFLANYHVSSTKCNVWNFLLHNKAKQILNSTDLLT